MLILRVSLVLLALLATSGSGFTLAVAAPQDAPRPAASPSPPPTPPPGPDPLLEFVPREHVPADSAVSFPVDI
jgi:hypothetical protein